MMKDWDTIINRFQRCSISDVNNATNLFYEALKGLVNIFTSFSRHVEPLWYAQLLADYTSI